MKPSRAIAVLILTAITPAPAPGRADEPDAGSRLALTALEKEWGDAIVKRDAPALRRILAEDYVLTTPDGQVVTREQLLTSLRAPRGDAFVLEDIVNGEATFRVYGDTAVVHARFVLKGRAGGQEVETPFRHTDVFVRQRGHWRCVARQSTRVAEPSGGGPGQAAK